MSAHAEDMTEPTRAHTITLIPSASQSPALGSRHPFQLRQHCVRHPGQKCSEAGRASHGAGQWAVPQTGTRAQGQQHMFKNGVWRRWFHTELKGESAAEHRERGVAPQAAPISRADTVTDKVAGDWANHWGQTRLTQHHHELNRTKITSIYWVDTHLLLDK